MVLMQKKKKQSQTLMWHNDLNESRVIARCTCCFCIDPASQKRQGEPVLIIDREHAEKNSLFVVSLGY